MTTKGPSVVCNLTNARNLVPPDTLLVPSEK
uniref:Uncharacterized protein n=1 Tax=Arundo donax TaxID=35708 RepID=A0A0A9AH33_ARUDO